MKNPLLKTIMGRHGLKAWGIRLGILKGKFATDNKEVMAEWSPEMQAYCEQDVEVTDALFKLIEKKNYSPEALRLEFDFQWVIAQQERTGFGFDRRHAEKLYSTLSARREAIRVELQALFPADVEVMKTPEYWYWEDEPEQGQLFKVPTRHTRPTKGEAEKAMKALGIKRRKPKAGPFRTKSIPFNPGSGLQVADRLGRKYGWKPIKFTDKGQPEITEDVLKPLPYPEAKLMIEYALVDGRCGQVAEGPQAWLKNERKGRLYGRIITNGAVTGRCTHKLISNVPKAPSPYGKECRECFVASPGFVLVGTDAAALELRCLAHFMAKYDDGKYAEAVLHGSKPLKTTVHHITQQLCGLATYDAAKTFNYAFIYGAGDHKLGFSFYNPDDPKDFKAQQEVLVEDIKRFKANRTAWGKMLERCRWRGYPETDMDLASSFKGAELRDRLLEGLPALAKVTEDAKKEARELGYIVGLDKRRLCSRAQHSALNTRLQSAGALAMKKALNILHFELCPQLNWGYDDHYHFVTNYHDEIQAETRPEIAVEFGQATQLAITKAGEFFGFRCPLAGESKVGKNWHETH